jgi:hypothetical protein
VYCFVSDVAWGVQPGDAVDVNVIKDDDVAIWCRMLDAVAEGVRRKEDGELPSATYSHVEALWIRVFMRDGTADKKALELMFEHQMPDPKVVRTCVAYASLSPGKAAEAAGRALVNGNVAKHLRQERGVFIGVHGIRNALNLVLDSGNPDMLQQLCKTTSNSMMSLLDQFGFESFLKECLSRGHVDLMWRALTGIMFDPKFSTDNTPRLLESLASQAVDSHDYRMAAAVYAFGQNPVVRASGVSIPATEEMLTGWLMSINDKPLELQHEMRALRMSLVDTCPETEAAWEAVRRKFKGDGGGSHEKKAHFEFADNVQSLLRFSPASHRALLQEISLAMETPVSSRMPRFPGGWRDIWQLHDSGDMVQTPKNLENILLYAASHTAREVGIPLTDVLNRMQPSQKTTALLRRVIVMLLTRGHGDLESPVDDKLLSMQHVFFKPQGLEEEYARLDLVCNSGPEGAREELWQFALVVAAATGKAATFQHLLLRGVSLRAFDWACYAAPAWFPLPQCRDEGAPRDNSLRFSNLFPWMLARRDLALACDRVAEAEGRRSVVSV